MTFEDGKMKTVPKTLVSGPICLCCAFVCVLYPGQNEALERENNTVSFKHDKCRKHVGKRRMDFNLDSLKGKTWNAQL
jgi:hypothetical protein